VTVWRVVGDYARLVDGKVAGVVLLSKESYVDAARGKSLTEKMEITVVRGRPRQ
jgi:hypothetical protein